MEALTADGSEENVLEEQQILGVMDRSYDTLEYAYPELEVISPLLSANEMATFNWNVSPGTRMVSNQFWVTKGQTIHIGSTAIPDSSTYWIGIMDGLNNARYRMVFRLRAADITASLCRTRAACRSMQREAIILISISLQ